jgi:cobalt-zinc-cadmium efflux system outer membrane protein
MRWLAHHVVVAGLLALAAPAAHAAEPPAPALATAPAPGAVAGGTIDLNQYLNRVGQANLDLAAQRLNLPVAEAQIAVARIFPDPTLTLNLAQVDPSGVAPTIFGLTLSGTVELGGKRGARVHVAATQRDGARADLDDFLRTLRATAANAFIDSLGARLVVDRKRETLKSLERLVTVNQIRLKAGAIGEVPLVQSRVEAQRFRAEVLGAEADVRVADLGLAMQAGLGRLDAAAGLAPRGDLRVTVRTFDAEALIAVARVNRPDVASKRLALQANRHKVTLAHANRWTDLQLSIGFAHTEGNGAFTNGAYANPFANPPNTLSLSAGIALPFSRVYKGELHGALAGRTQAEMQLRAAELKAEVEVRQALAKYDAAVAKLKLYTGGVLEDADRVHKATLYNYERGGATLLEVLEAQRTVNEVYLSYFSALTDHAHALVNLEQAAGIWDLSF